MRSAMNEPEKRKRNAAAFAAVTLGLMAGLAAGCRGLGVSQPGAGGLVTVSGTRFLDGTGKPLLLHGINIINKNPAEGYTARIEQSDFAAIHRWGMNCVRLGILWDGLEPQPGRVEAVGHAVVERGLRRADDDGVDPRRRAVLEVVAHHEARDARGHLDADVAIRWDNSLDIDAAVDAFATFLCRHRDAGEAKEVI